VVVLIGLVLVMILRCSMLIIDAIGRVRSRNDLTERLASFHKPQSVADEAERWLHSQ
jgi:hypothetical protein